MHSRLGNLVAVAALICAVGAQAQQQTPAGGQGNGGRAGGGGGRGPTPTKTDRYQSTFVKLGVNAADGLMYEPVTLAANSHVAVVTAYDAPAPELASRGYRMLYVGHTDAPGTVPSPLDGFDEISRGITYVRKLPGVQRVVIMGWGTSAMVITLYADVAAHGPAACQGKNVLDPCKTEEASGLAKPDGVVLLDPGLGAGSKVDNVDPAYDGDTRSISALDMFAAANGYDANTGTANYSADFRRKYYAAQSARNDKVIDDAVARLKVLDKSGPTADEVLIVPGGLNVGDVASLHHTDLSILSHTKRPHILLKADGSKPEVILQSVRPTLGPIGDDAIKKVVAHNSLPAHPNYTVRQYLGNDAIRTTKDFALTDDDVVGVDWKSSNEGTPANAEGVTLPTLVMTNTCFQFVVASEIVYDHLASKDKTFAGVEGSEHFFSPCDAKYGDTKKRLFDFVGDWLAKPGRF